MPIDEKKLREALRELISAHEDSIELIRLLRVSQNTPPAGGFDKLLVKANERVKKLATIGDDLR